MPGISIDPQILDEWGRLAADGLTCLDISLRSDAPADRSIAVLRQVVGRLVAEHDQVLERTKPRPGQEPAWPGEWHTIAMADGSVGIRVLECERADILLPRIADGLECAGIAGRMAPLQWPVAPSPPGRALVLECKMLVRGHRWQQRPGKGTWVPDPVARDRLIQMAASWLRSSRDERSVPALTISVLPPISLAPTDDVAERVLSNVDELNHINARIATSTGARIITWAPNTKQVGLIHVGDAHWSAPLADLRDTLVKAADKIAYGYIKRGRSPAAATNGYSLAEDWVPRQGHSADHVYRASTAAFYDEYAPDAFAIQLLGDRYSGRVPAAPSYHRQTVGDAILLEHTRPEAWYDQSFVPVGAHRDELAEIKPPPVLKTARAELDPILFSSDAIKHP